MNWFIEQFQSMPSQAANWTLLEWITYIGAVAALLDVIRRIWTYASKIINAAAVSVAKRGVLINLKSILRGIIDIKEELKQSLDWEDRPYHLIAWCFRALSMSLIYIFVGIASYIVLPSAGSFFATPLISIGLLGLVLFRNRLMVFNGYEEYFSKKTKGVEKSIQRISFLTANEKDEFVGAVRSAISDIIDIAKSHDATKPVLPKRPFNPDALKSLPVKNSVFNTKIKKSTED